MICCQRPLGLMCWVIRVVWLSFKRLPTDNVITFLSHRAEPLYDLKHIFFKNTHTHTHKKKRWAYVCFPLAHTHYRLGKFFSQGKNTNLSFSIVPLFRQQSPFTSAYLARFLFEDFIEICMKVRTILNPTTTSDAWGDSVMSRLVIPFSKLLTCSHF